MPPSGKDVSKLWGPVASADAAYLHWAATIPPYVGTTAADRIDTTGKRVWTFDSGSDANFGDWPSLWKDRLVLDSDGIYMRDIATGAKAAGTGVDWWGQSIPTDSALLLVDTSKADGPGLFVAALDDKAAVLWKQNEQGTQCGQGLTDQTGGIALDGTTLFYAPRYASGSTVQPSFASGVYAFDTTASGAKIWSVATTPASAISAAGGLVFLVEKPASASAKLVARKQSDGSVAWSADLASAAGVQAPAIAGGTVIVGTQGGLFAYAANDGTPRWNTPKPNGYAAPASLTIDNACGGPQPVGNLPDTAIAIAGGSATLVVTQGKEVFVVSLVRRAGRRARHTGRRDGHARRPDHRRKTRVRGGAGDLLALASDRARSSVIDANPRPRHAGLLPARRGIPRSARRGSAPDRHQIPGAPDVRRADLKRRRTIKTPGCPPRHSIPPSLFVKHTVSPPAAMSRPIGVATTAA